MGKWQAEAIRASANQATSVNGNNRRSVTVQGIQFEVWHDFTCKGTYCDCVDERVNWKNVQGYIMLNKRLTPVHKDAVLLSDGYYVNNDLTIRKAIATRYNLPSFRI